MKLKTLFAVTLLAGVCVAQETVPAAKVAPAAVAKAAQAKAEAPAIATEGAVIGQWTMDSEAAFALAKKEGKPVFINFTGSDWCVWCKLMDRSVFSRETWKAYAKDALVLLWVDFPRDKTLVPEAIAEKNKALAEKFDVRGFPTYVILAPEGKEIGRLRASQTSTAKDFVEKVKGILVLQRIGTLLSAEDFAVYESLKTQKKELEEKLQAWQEKVRKEGEAFQTTTSSLESRIEVYVKKAVEAAEK